MRTSDLARLLILAMLWGGSFLLYRIVTPVLGTIVSTEARVAIAGIVLLAWQMSVGPRFEWRRHARAMTVVGLFNSAVPFALFGFAAHTLPTAYLAIINATSPLFGAVIAWVWLGEALNLTRSLGIATGVVGVIALVGLGPVATDPTTAIAIAACLVAAASYGFAANYTRQLAHPVPPTTRATGSQFVAALWVVPLLPLEPLHAMPSGAMVGATLILAIACTSLAYLLYFRLISDLGATRALTVTFLIPLFATAWAWLILDEVPTPRMGIGGALVLIATWLIVRTSRAAVPKATFR